MPSNSIDLLLTARWVIPVEPEGAVLEHHALAVDQGRIIALLPAQEAVQRYQARETVRLAGHALLPGFINAHTHAAMNLLRGYADDRALMDWLQNHIWPAEAKWVGPEFVCDGSQLAIAEMLRGGVTCFNDMYFFPEETARVAAAAGIRAILGMIVIDFPSAYAAHVDEYFKKGLALHDECRDHALIHTGFAPHAPYTVSDDAFRRIATLTGELNVPISIHVHETAGEVREALAKTGERPLKRLERLGLITPQLLAVHMTQLEPHEIALLAAQGAHVIHCPESNLKLASGFCPVAALLKAGVNVALGTDGAASNNDLDMFGEMRTAALLAKAVANDATAVPAAQALRMATLNGARALGMDDLTGSLVCGKAADVIAVDLSPVETQPVHDPISQIVYAAARDQVTDVWVAGRQLLKQRKLLTLDVPAVSAAAHLWRDKLHDAR
ncbi:MAG TPA: TRZ/ATZ family hydrolase [Gammaproteobacteria bacterium]|nr:TRZ/ATZ family hydrolase [Gammaproteobacteria bacterium]